MKEHYENENEEMKKSQRGGGTKVLNKDGTVKSPDFLSKPHSPPTYVANRSKK